MSDLMAVLILLILCLFIHIISSDEGIGVCFMEEPDTWTCYPFRIEFDMEDVQ